MAYYKLADSFFFDDFASARKEIALAATLAEHLPLPRQEKLLIQAAKLRYDGRSEEAEQVLHTVLRDFPRETEPRFTLAFMLLDEGRLAETKSTMEEILRLDERKVEAYNGLAYADAAQGDLTGALVALDKYAALLPPNDPNPVDSRGDVLAMNGNYKDATLQYRNNLDLNPSFFMGQARGKIALAYLYQGNELLAQTRAKDWYKNSVGAERAMAAGVLGDIDVAQGQLNRAVAFYEESARILGRNGSTLAEAPLLKASHIYFEHHMLKAALALGRRDTTVWAPGIRAMAYLLLDDEPAAEKEFAILRRSLTPLFGDYMAEKTVEVDRVIANEYAGHWQQVIAGWPHVSKATMKTKFLEFPIARAYLEEGNLPEAERHLRSLLQSERNWGYLGEMASHDFLSYMLAQFYLGKVLEQTDRKPEAIKAYQDFLRHSKNSNVDLQQIAEARAALKTLSVSAPKSSMAGGVLKLVRKQTKANYAKLQ